jgi:hypothetical protein
VIGTTGRTAELTRRMLIWEHFHDQLLVEFDEDGWAVKAEVANWPGPTPWERFRACLGW